MKTILVLLSGVLVIFLACDKDKFESKPTLEVKSVKSKNLDLGDNFSATLGFTDKEGDVDSVLYIIRERTNVKGKRTVADDYLMPEFPNTSKGDIQVTLSYALQLTQGFTAIPLPGNQKQADTMNIKFVLKDRAKNLSDTAVISNVIIIR
jgi:hypothetical protein